MKTMRILVLLLLWGVTGSTASGAEDARRHWPRPVNDVVLVQGAFADGSTWSRVIAHLQREGFNVMAVQLRLQSVADDVALVRHAISQIPRPVVVAAHSYGGAVISEATTGAPNVAALVFVAAFALDQGESILSVAAGYPTSPAFMHLVIDDQGNATVDPPAFVRYFAPDVPRADARVAAAVQRPTAASVFGTPLAGVPAWKTIPSFYQVSTEDQAIDPDLERFFAQRMGATTIELRSSHVSLISHADAVSELIERAAGTR